MSLSPCSLPCGVSTLLRSRFLPCLTQARQVIVDHPVWFSLLAALVARKVQKKLAKRIPNGIWLELDLNDITFVETPLSPFARFMNPKAVDIHDLIETIDRAAEDDRVAGLILKLGRKNFCSGFLQELRNALVRFRAAKVTIAFSEAVSEYGNGMTCYWLATACEYVYLVPSGFLGLVSPNTTVPFLKQMFEKLAIGTEISQRRAYKSFGDTLAREDMSDEHREMMESLVDSLYDTYIRDISKDRELSDDLARQLFSEGPYLGPLAKEKKLVDGLLYRDQLFALIGKAAASAAKAGSPLRLVGEGEKAKDNEEDDPQFPRLLLQTYAERIGPATRKGCALFYGVVEAVRPPPIVAVIKVEGAIHCGTSKTLESDSSTSIGSDTVCRALRAAVDDKRVAVIVLRVSSGGGSAIASDLIYRETLRAKERGKAVVVSMGTVAASGGYYISAGANCIFALPTTLTGSIGVLLGKMDFRGMWGKLGVTFDDLERGGNSNFFSALHPYTPEGIERRERLIDAVYEDFKAKVAAGRGMSADEVEAVAQGRVWTGEQALSRGLVDKLGGLHEAVAYAKTLAASGKCDVERVVVADYPPPLSLFKKLTMGSPEHTDSPNATCAVGGAVRSAGPLSGAAGLLLGVAAALPGIGQTLRFANTASSVVSLVAAQGGMPVSAALQQGQAMLDSGDIAMVM